MFSRNFGFERGQVFFLQEGNAYGAEMMSGRPVVIISEQGALDALPTAVVACLTRTVRDSWPSFVPVELEGGVSHVVCNQLRTVDKGRLTKFKCKLTDEEMAQVDSALRNALGLSQEMLDDFEMHVCQVEVAEPIDIRVAESNENELFELKAELAMYKKLYEKAVSEFVELKFQKDTNVEKIVEVELPKKEIVETISKKKGRPTKNAVPWKATKEEIAPYANESGKANVNTDPWYVIAATTGMNRQTAQEIVAHRNKHGKFKSLVDLLDVNKFGHGCINKYGNMLEV